MTSPFVPEGLKFTCNMCGIGTIGLAGSLEHLSTAHDLVAARWPDGGLVVDMSEVPELAGEL